MTSTDVAQDASDARRTDTRQRILDVSTRLFREYGFAATSTQSIADELGVTKAALYYHFESKEDILVALKQPVVDGLSELLDAPADYATPAGRRAFLEALVDTLVRCGADMASLITDARASHELRSAVEQTGLPQQIAGRLLVGITGHADPAKAPLGAVMRVSATFGALHGAFDGWIQVNPGTPTMDAASQRAVVDAAAAALESGS